MNKTTLFLVLISTIAVLTLSSSFVSAGSYYYDDSPSWYTYSSPSLTSFYSTNTHYEETPSLTVFPKEKAAVSATSNYKDTNYDSTARSC